MLGILGVVLAVLGVLILLGVIGGGTVVAILLLVAGVLCIAYSQGAFTRFR